MIGKLRTLGVAFVAVFAMSAMAASAAHAEETHFTAGNGTGTAKFTAEADPSAKPQVFVTPKGTITCEIFHATGMGAATTTEVTLENVEYEECEFEHSGIEAFVEFNGCHYTIHGSGEVEIGPVGVRGDDQSADLHDNGAGRPELRLRTLEYTNVTTEGKPMEITIHAHTGNNVHGSANAGCPGGAASFITGNYSGTLTARAFTTGGTQIDLTA